MKGIRLRAKRDTGLAKDHFEESYQIQEQLNELRRQGEGGVGMCLLDRMLCVYKNVNPSLVQHLRDPKMAQTLDQVFFSIFSNPVPVYAFIIGIVGSLAYYTALRLGYIGGENQASLLEVFDGWTIVAFCLLGGGIAAIFQMAQPNAFAPIQALVLGITWPTLISQYVTAAGKTENEKFIRQIEGAAQL
jgi:hypothetical protein